MIAKLLAVLGFVSACAATSITTANFDDVTSGKTVFIKFQAPWCGHCKKMKPDWDKLMEAFKDNEKILVGDCDCTSDEGKELCGTVGVKGYPTIKYGDPANLQDYQGGRDFDALNKFASELKPLCSPKNIDLCDDDQKKEIEKIMAMPLEDIEKRIKEDEDAVKKAEEHFNSEVQKLQNAYQKLQEDRDETVKKIAESGGGLHKQCAAEKKKAASEKKDEKDEL